MPDPGDTFDMINTARMLREGEITRQEAFARMVSTLATADEFEFLRKCKHEGLGAKESIDRCIEKFGPRIEGMDNAWLHALKELIAELIK